MTSLYTRQHSIGFRNGDAVLTLTGTQLEITVPAGVTHDAWVGNNGVVQVQQAVEDVDFEIEVKFESALTTQFQSQGIMVEQTALDFLRIEFHHFGGQNHLFIATIFGQMPLANIS